MDQAKLFTDEIESVWQAAYHSEIGGGAAWAGVLEKYGAEPLTKDEKAKLSSGDMKITKGAYPNELRRVLVKVNEKYSSLVSTLEGEEKEKLSSALSSFNPDQKVMEYYSKIKPFSGLNDIFKNSAIGTQKYSSGLKGEKHYTFKCKNCGSPRLEEDQYDECLFCGSKLFENTK